MKTTGVRPDEFAASTWPDSRAVRVAMPANLHLPVLNGAGIGPLDRKAASATEPGRVPRARRPAGLQKRPQSEARAGSTRSTRSSRAGIHQFQRPKSVTSRGARREISEAHDVSWQAALAYLEREACVVRRGHAG